MKKNFINLDYNKQSQIIFKRFIKKTIIEKKKIFTNI